MTCLYRQQTVKSKAVVLISGNSFFPVSRRLAQMVLKYFLIPGRGFWNSICRDYLCINYPDKLIHMNLRLPVSVCFLVMVVFSSTAQRLKKADKVTLGNLEQEIHYLADDKLEGRRTGTRGEKLASEYIITTFQRAGLTAGGPYAGWLQPFPVDDGKQIAEETGFIVNHTELVLGNDFFPWRIAQPG